MFFYKGRLFENWLVLYLLKYSHDRRFLLMLVLISYREKKMKRIVDIAPLSLNNDIKKQVMPILSGF